MNQTVTGQWNPLTQPPLGTQLPASLATTPTWDIRKAGVVIATNQVPNDWSVSWDGEKLWVKPPLQATMASDYEVRYSTGQSSNGGGGNPYETGQAEG